MATSNAGLVLLKPGHCHKGAYAVGPVAAAGMVKVEAPLDASVSFTDADLAGMRSVSWSWADDSGTPAPIRSGKASFYFIAPSDMNAQPVSTKAQLHFDVVGLSFRGDNLRLVTARGARNQFEGSGTINGVGAHKFTPVTAVGAAAGAGASA